MKAAKVDVLIALFAYSGNGGVASTIPELAIWLAATYHKCKTDERINRVAVKIYCDTPITMTRNRAVRDAKALGCDMLLMLDSDNEPDGYLTRFPDQAKPFWDTAFSFAYRRLLRGEPTVIAAPYCGPPPHPVQDGGGEVPYLFEWGNKESDNPNCSFKLNLMTRNEAAKLSGIYPVAALPTGVCLFTLNAFEGLKHPYFEYEYSEDHAEKKSTEDVVAIRDISLHWKITKGYDVVWAACDSWALHHKTKKVGRPQFVALESVSPRFAEAIYEQRTAGETKMMVDFTANLPINQEFQEIQTDIGPQRINVAEIRAAIAESLPAMVSVDTEKQNGHALRHRMIGGKKIAAIPTEISEDSIENIESLTTWLVDKREGPIEVAVAHAGSGQSSAAILSRLPEGSHLYALDSLLTYKFDKEPSQQFAKSFQGELESGRVMADLIGRKFPYPQDQQHLDLVFIERAVTAAKIEKLYEHVTSGGLLAGTGYEQADVMKSVNEFAEKYAVKARFSGDIWAIPK